MMREIWDRDLQLVVVYRLSSHLGMMIIVIILRKLILIITLIQTLTLILNLSSFPLSLLYDTITEQARLLQSIYYYSRNEQREDTGFIRKHYSLMI